MTPRTLAETQAQTEMPARPQPRQEAESLLDELYAPGAEVAISANSGNGAVPRPTATAAPPTRTRSVSSRPTRTVRPRVRARAKRLDAQSPQLDRLRAEIRMLLAPSSAPFASPSSDDRQLPRPQVGEPQPQVGEAWVPQTPTGPTASSSMPPTTSPQEARPAPEPVTKPEPRPEQPHPQPGSDAQEAPPQPAEPRVVDPRHALDEEIRTLYQEVTQVLAERRGLTGHALGLLREARTIVLTQPERMARARYNVRQVRAMLEAAREERRRSRRAALTLAGYLGLTVALCAAALAVLAVYHPLVVRASRAFWFDRPDLAPYTPPFLWAFWAGGLGAALAGFQGLVADLRAGQLFDRRLVLRYLLQPVMGFVLALLVFLAAFFLLDSLISGWAGHPWLRFVPVVLAFAAGYGQLVVYGLLFRFVGFLTFRPRRRHGPG